MNEITVQAQSLMTKLATELQTEMVWKATPLGHTPFQIERFILNDNEFPKSGGAKFRQCVRELWARWGAYWQNRDQQETLAIDLDEARHDSRWSLNPFARRRGVLKVKQIERKLNELQLDLEHRIMPETEQFLRIARECAPDDAKVFDYENEWKVWKHRATAQPKLRELIGPEPKGASRGDQISVE